MLRHLTEVDFSRADKLSESNGLFSNTGLTGLVMGRDYCTLDMAFAFTAGSVLQETGIVEQMLVKSLHTIYSNLVSSLSGYKRREMTEDVQIGEIRRQSKEFQSTSEIHAEIKL